MYIHICTYVSIFLLTHIYNVSLQSKIALSICTCIRHMYNVHVYTYVCKYLNEIISDCWLLSWYLTVFSVILNTKIISVICFSIISIYKCMYVYKYIYVQFLHIKFNSFSKQLEGPFAMVMFRIQN